VVTPDPSLNYFLKILGLLDEQVCVCFRRDIRHVVIHLIALAAALFEIGGEGDHRRAERQFQSLKRRLVMSEAHDPVALAGENNFGELQDGVVGGGKAAIIGKFTDFGVGEVALNNGAKIMNLARAGPMGADPLSV
jgi:hypothetical protein